MGVLFVSLIPIELFIFKTGFESCCISFLFKNTQIFQELFTSKVDALTRPISLFSLKNVDIYFVDVSASAFLSSKPSIVFQANSACVSRIVGFQVSYADMQKPGQCYPLTGINNCRTTCQNDWECPGLAKCCGATFANLTCGRSCQEPCSKTCDSVTCTNGTECIIHEGCAVCGPCKNCANGNNKDKPGKCAPWYGSGICLTNCDTDAECSGQQKCCPLGTCGKLCQDPCPTKCDAFPPCISGNECKIVNGCAQCVPEKRKK